IEHKREKQFIIALISDLYLDTTELNFVINSFEKRVLTIDSTLDELTRINNNQISISLYRKLRRSTDQYHFYPNNGTLSQLKNSGGMRLIRKRGAVDSIEGYGRQIQRLEFRRDVNRENIHDYHLLMNKLISGSGLYEVLFDTLRFDRTGHDQSISINNQYMDEFIHQLIITRGQVSADIGRNSFVNNKALNMIIYLKKEYHLK